MRTIYHGSKEIMKRPEYEEGRIFRDYGSGFYCTEDSALAKEWAVSLDRNGYSNIYEIDETGLSILDLNDDSYSLLNWLAVLLANREFDCQSVLAQEARDYILSEFSVDLGGYDIVIGRRADNSCFTFAQDFLNGVLSWRQFSRMVKNDKALVYVLKSQKAFDRLEYLGNVMVIAGSWYALKESRDRKLRRDYFDDKKNARKKGDLYIAQILDEEMKANDARLR